MDLIVEEKEIKKVRLDFNKAHITYKNAAGQKVVGATTALGILNKPALIGWAYNKGKNGENLYEKDESGNIGTIIHARILGHFLGYEIDSYNISQEAWDQSQNALDSFLEWIRGHEIEPIIIETSFVNEEENYGGTPDFYGHVDKILALMDWKSGSGIYDEHIYQIISYAKLLESNGYKLPERCIALNIPKSGDDSFAFQNFPTDSLIEEWEIFKYCKNIYYLQKQIKLRKKGKK